MLGWKLLSAVAVVFSVSASLTAHAADRDPYEGEWAGDCGTKFQCWIEIEHKSGKNYNLRFVAADRMDASKVLCKQDIAMERGRLEFTVHENYDDALSGELPNDPLVWVLPFLPDSIALNAKTKCGGKYGMQREYFAFGD
jgi:hypothetical protein